VVKKGSKKYKKAKKSKGFKEAKKSKESKRVKNFIGFFIQVVLGNLGYKTIARNQLL